VQVQVVKEEIAAEDTNNGSAGAQAESADLYLPLILVVVIALFTLCSVVLVIVRQFCQKQRLKENAKEDKASVDVNDPYGHQYGGLQMYGKVRRVHPPRNISEQAVTGSVDFSAAQYMHGVHGVHGVVGSRGDGDLMSLTKPRREPKRRTDFGGRETRRETKRHGRSRTRASDWGAQGGQEVAGGTRRFTDGMYRVQVPVEDEDEEEESHLEGGSGDSSETDVDESETDEEKSIETFPAYHNITNSEFARLQKAITSARTKSDFARLERIIRNGLIPSEAEWDGMDDGGMSAAAMADGSRRRSQANLVPDLVRMRQISETIQSVYNNLPNMETHSRSKEPKQQRRRGRQRRRDSDRDRGRGRGSQKKRGKKGGKAKDFMPVLDEEELTGKLNQLSLNQSGVGGSALEPGDSNEHGIAISPINREYMSEMEDLDV